MSLLYRFDIDTVDDLKVLRKLERLEAIQKDL